MCVDSFLIPVLLAACVQPCCSDWVGRIVRWGAEHMSFFVVIRWLGLRKSRTLLRPFSGHRRNQPGRGPLCVPPPPVHLLMQTSSPFFAQVCTKHHHKHYCVTVHYHTSKFLTLIAVLLRQFPLHLWPKPRKTWFQCCSDANRRRVLFSAVIN